jgi:hypothetical protein
VLWGKGEEEANGNGERQGLGEMTVFNELHESTNITKDSGFLKMVHPPMSLW